MDSDEFAYGRSDEVQVRFDLTLGNCTSSDDLKSNDQKQINFINLILKSKSDNRLTDSTIESILEILKFYEENRQDLTIPISLLVFFNLYL